MWGCRHSRDSPSLEVPPGQVLGSPGPAVVPKSLDPAHPSFTPLSCPAYIIPLLIYTRWKTAGTNPNQTVGCGFAHPQPESAFLPEDSPPRHALCCCQERSLLIGVALRWSHRNHCTGEFPFIIPDLIIESRRYAGTTGSKQKQKSSPRWRPNTGRFQDKGAVMGFFLISYFSTQEILRYSVPDHWGCEGHPSLHQPWTGSK